MEQQFGGPWTVQKLEVLAKYLRAYTTALKNKPRPDNPFRKTYIDAFAGSGYRKERRPRSATGQEVLPDLAEQEPQSLLAGSARRALQTEPPFDRYIFIEKSPGRVKELLKLRDEFPDLADRIDPRRAEANTELHSICGGNWGSDRAVLFLDPYGMQVGWNTLEAIASTKAIDLWLLFPFGIGVNRLLKKSGEIPESWKDRLTAFLGTDRWFEEFYEVQAQGALFESKEQLVKVRMDKIGRFFVNRLKEIFPGVAENPGVLRNSVNNPLYLLCFACANERGKEVAIRIANHLLKGVR